MTSLLLSRSSEDVRDQLPRVDDSVVLCPLSRRQHFMYSDYLANRFCFVVLTVSLFSTLNSGSNKNVHRQLIVIGCCGICVVDKVITMMNMHVPGMMKTCWSSPNCVTFLYKIQVLHSSTQYCLRDLMMNYVITSWHLSAFSCTVVVLMWSHPRPKYQCWVFIHTETLKIKVSMLMSGCG